MVRVGTNPNLVGASVVLAYEAQRSSGQNQPFHAELADLADGTTYHFRAVADGGYGPGSGDVRRFTTAPAETAPTAG